MPRNLQWTRFDKALPTDESKALAVQYGNGSMVTFQPPWDVKRNKLIAIAGVRWAYDTDPIAPPREEDEKPLPCPVCGRLPCVLRQTIPRRPVEIWCPQGTPEICHKIAKAHDYATAVKWWNAGIAEPKPTDSERVVVSIKALWVLRRLLDDAAGTTEAVAPNYLDEIINSAKPVGVKTCKYTWDKIGRRWNTECGDQYQFADCESCPRCGGRIVKEDA